MLHPFHDYVLSIIMVLFASVLFMQVWSQSDNLCIGNSWSTTCTQNDSALVQLLTETNEDVGYLIRCQYAYDNTSCMNMEPQTCVWDQGACHISASNLVDTLFACVNESKWTNSSKNVNQQCFNHLKSVGQNYSWIDYDLVENIDECSNSYYQNFFSNWLQNDKCTLIDNLYTCGSSSMQSSYCTQVTSNQPTIGEQFVSTLRYLLYGDVQDTKSLYLDELEKVLNLEVGTLVKYVQCDQYTLSSQCKSKQVSPSPFVSYYYYYYYSPRYSSPSPYFNSPRLPSTKQKDNSNIAVVLWRIVLGVTVGTVMFILIGFVIGKIVRKLRPGNTPTEVRAATAPESASAPELPSVTTSSILNTLPTLHFANQDYTSEKLCAICFDEFQEGEESTIFACAHQFHLCCAKEWITSKGNNVFCPLCNFKLSDTLQQQQ